MQSQVIQEGEHLGWKSVRSCRQVKLDAPVRQQRGNFLSSFEYVELEHKSELEAGN